MNFVCLLIYPGKTDEDKILIHNCGLAKAKTFLRKTKKKELQETEKYQDKMAITQTIIKLNQIIRILKAATFLFEMIVKIPFKNCVWNKSVQSNGFCGAADWKDK